MMSVNRWTLPHISVANWALSYDNITHKRKKTSTIRIQDCTTRFPSVADPRSVYLPFEPQTGFEPAFSSVMRHHRSKRRPLQGHFEEEVGF